MRPTSTRCFYLQMHNFCYAFVLVAFKVKKFTKQTPNVCTKLLCFLLKNSQYSFFSTPRLTGPLPFPSVTCKGTNRNHAGDAQQRSRSEWGQTGPLLGGSLLCCQCKLCIFWAAPVVSGLSAACLACPQAAPAKRNLLIFWFAKVKFH